MDFNLETFVEQYIAALRTNNAEELVNLIGSLEGDDQRDQALAGVIKAIETDKELAELASDALAKLKNVEEVLSEVKAEA